MVTPITTTTTSTRRSVSAITTIVVPLDADAPSERAIPVAGTLALALGATVELVTIDPTGFESGPDGTRLDALGAALPQGVDVASTVIASTGSVADALSALDRGPGSLVCMASHGRGAFAALARGSASEAMVRRSAMPVLIVGPECDHVAPPGSGRPTVVAIDDDTRDSALLDTAADWARATGSELVLAHVVTAPADPDTWVAGQELLDDAAGRLRVLGIEATTELSAAGDAGQGLLAEVRRRDAWGLVLGSHRRGAVGRAVLGSTVDRLARHAHVPVLVAAVLRPLDVEAEIEVAVPVGDGAVDLGPTDPDLGALLRMDEAECLGLLEAGDVGRLAIVQGHTPAIFPVNYVLDGRDIVFRTAPGTKLQHGTDSMAAFEIDDLDPERRTGWSVVVTGWLEQVTSDEPRLRERLRTLPIGPWPTGPKDHIMRLVSGIITGRNLPRPGRARPRPMLRPD